MAPRKPKKAREGIQRERPPFALRSVYLRSSEVSLAADFDPLVPGIPLIATHRISKQECTVRRTEFSTDTGASHLIVSAAFVTTFEFRYLKDANDAEKFLVSVIADFLADYLVDKSEDPSQEELLAWGGHVLVHTWPYWREYCHSTLLRMSVPATVMPMFFGDLAQNGADQSPESPKTRD